MFRLVDASFSIDEKPILSTTNLTFESGKVTTLLGHNGCGKSTLIKLLSRQNKPTSGHVFYGDQSVHDLSNIEFAHQVAYLPNIHH